MSDEPPAMPTANTAEPSGYAPLRHAAAWCELPPRAIVEATGVEAVAFVDRFTTAALGGLLPGQGAETIFTDARGWVLALALVLRHDDALEIDAGHGPRVALHDHLEHFHIRERVEFRDATDRWASFLVAGPAAPDALAARLTPPPSAAGGHVAASVDGTAVRVARVDWFDGIDAFLVRVAAAEATTVRRWLVDAELPEASAEAVAAVRIESRYPDPIDIDAKTLPQELERPAGTISFTKGCYLGQETVARLDALGHVNRRLVLLAGAGAVPAAVGTPVLVDGTESGVVTSSCLSPLHGGPLSMCLLHQRGHAPDAMIMVAGERVRLVPTANSARGTAKRGATNKGLT